MRSLTKARELVGVLTVDLAAIGEAEGEGVVFDAALTLETLRDELTRAIVEAGQVRRERDSLRRRLAIVEDKAATLPRDAAQTSGELAQKLRGDDAA